VDTKFLKGRFWIGSKHAAAHAICLGLAVVLLVGRFPRVLSQLSMNLAAIHLVRSGIGVTWPMHWHWNADGKLSLDDDSKEANSISTRNSREVAQAFSYALWAAAFWTDNPLSRRTLAYLDFASGNYGGLQENLAAVAKTDAQRPWDSFALVKLYEWQGEHGLAVAALKGDDTVDYLLVVAERLSYSDGQAENARRMAALAVEAAPDSARALYLLGHILVLDGREAEEAVQVFSRGLQLQPENVDMQIGLAHALVEAGRYEDAMGQLRSVLPKASNDSTVHLLLGEVYLNQGDLADAAREYSFTLNLAPKQVWALYGLGRVYAAEGRKAEAIFAWRSALQIDPGFEPAANALNSYK
jgi:tetratricopeptide (TPR) repeat protein